MCCISRIPRRSVKWLEADSSAVESVDPTKLSLHVDEEISIYNSGKLKQKHNIECNDVLLYLDQV